MKFTVDECDISAYGDVKLPTLENGFILANALGTELTSFGLDYRSVLTQIENSYRNPSGVFNPDGGPTINNYYRSSSFLHVSDNVCNMIKNRFDHVMDHLFGPDQYELCEPIGFLVYDESNSGHFSKHTDSAYWDGNGNFLYPCPRRKLTTVTYLNDDYEGGEIVLHSVRYPNGDVFSHKLSPGTMLIFPSDLRFPHEVKPVTKGKRYSIVAWYDYKTLPEIFVETETLHRPSTSIKFFSETEEAKFLTASIEAAKGFISREEVLSKDSRQLTTIVTWKSKADAEAFKNLIKVFQESVARAYDQKHGITNIMQSLN